MKDATTKSPLLAVPVELKFDADGDRILRVLMDEGTALVCPDSDEARSQYIAMLGASMALQQGVTVYFRTDAAGENTITGIKST